MKKRKQHNVKRPENDKRSKNDKEPKKVREISIKFGNNEVCFSISDMIQIVMAIFTLMSLVGVIFTLYEMQKDRNAAYKPTVLMNAVDFQISWNTNGEEEWLSAIPNESKNSYEVNEDGSITGTFSLPINIFPHNGLEKFTVVNIGVGAAKDIYFEWDQNNLSYLSNYLAEQDPSKADFCTVGESAVFSYDKRLIVTDVDSSVRIMYMLPDATETYTLPLPTAYSILIHEIMKCNSLPQSPHIILYAEYSDVQGRSTKDIFYISINRTYYESETDNSGTATYQLTPTLLTG